MTLVPALVQFDSGYKIASLQPERAHKSIGPFDHYISILIPAAHISGLQVINYVFNLTENFEKI